MISKDFIMTQLKEVQPLFEKEGVHILGLFGSYSRNQATEQSDIDILIETTPKFLQKYRGFKTFSKLDDMKIILKSIFHKEIDFADKQGLIQHKNEYILDKTLYV